jgi:hypothetical protein
MFDTWRAVFLLRKKNRKKKELDNHAQSVVWYLPRSVDRWKMGLWDDERHTHAHAGFLSLCVLPTRVYDVDRMEWHANIYVREMEKKK